MKQLYLLFALSISSLSLTAQNIIDKYYQHYVDHEESTVIHVSALTFQYAAHFVPDNTEEEQEIKEFVETIHSFDLVSVPNLEIAGQEYRMAVDRIAGDYDELVNIKDGADRFSVYIDEEDGIVYELVGIGVDETDFIIFSLVGEIRLDQIGKFINKMESDNFEPLKRAKIGQASDLRVYPNPVNVNAELTMDIPEELVGGEIQIFDTNGQMVRTLSAASNQNQIDVSSLTPGYYVLSIENAGVTMKKKVLVVR